MRNTLIIIGGLFLTIILGILIGFGASRRLAFNRFNWQVNNQPRYQFQPRMGIGRGMKAGRFQGTIQGQVTKIDNNNITLQLTNGGTYTFTIGDQTVIAKAIKGVKADLKLNQNVTVLGGSFINGAQTVIINP